MEREHVALHVIPALGLVIVAAMSLMLVVTTFKRKHLSPFLVFKAYLLFGAVLVFGGYLVISPFLEGHTLAEVLALDGEEDEVAAEEAEPPAHVDVLPERRSLPEMSEAEARMTIMTLGSRSRFTKMDAIERLLERSPPERHRAAVIGALHPLTNDPDGGVRDAARRAMATLQ